MKSLPLVAMLCALAALWAACSQEKQHYVPNAESGDITPTMATKDVSTLISDSGYTRYRVDTPLWLMFEDAEEPFWRFPLGIALEQYDLQMNPESNVESDSALYLSRKRVWRLDGNVVMVNTERDSFLTQQLFWDQNQRKIYTDSFIHIVRSDRTIEGYGFESDQSMLWYTVKNPTAILPAQRPGQKKEKADSTAPAATADTVAPQPKQPQQRSSKKKPSVYEIETTPADPKQPELPALPQRNRNLQKMQTKDATI